MKITSITPEKFASFIDGLDARDEYIKTFGDRFIIKVLDNGIDRGYYCGSVKPYIGIWEGAKCYKSKATAERTAKREGIKEYCILSYSELIK